MIDNFDSLKNLNGGNVSAFLEPKKDASPTEKKPDLRKMNPWQVIKEAAAGMGIRVNDPNPSCKHCHGRGYTGIRHDTGEPLPCKCIWPKSMLEEEANNGYTLSRPKNRAERRQKKRGK